MIFSPRIDITLLSSNFTVSQSAVGVTQLPGYFIMYPPTVNIVQFVSSFKLSHVTNYPVVCDISKSILRLIFFEGNCVCALYEDFHYLDKASDLNSKQDSPCILVILVFTKVVVFK